MCYKFPMAILLKKKQGIKWWNVGLTNPNWIELI